jgi:hypothetical protein
MIKGLIDRGIDVTVDQYPYDGAATSRLMDVLIKPGVMKNENMLTALKNPGMRARIKEVTENPGPQVVVYGCDCAQVVPDVTLVFPADELPASRVGLQESCFVCEQPY